MKKMIFMTALLISMTGMAQKAVMTFDKMVHDFGYPNCKIMNYWDDNYPVKVDNEAVKSIVLNNGKKVMIIFASWAEKPVTVNVKLAPSLKVKDPVFQIKFNKFGAAIIEKEIIK